jgi:hypothetical protein
VLAALADREINGAVTNCRMAVRKQRDGVSGFEIPFAPQMIDLGLDEDGDPLTAIALDWGQQQHGGTASRRKSKGVSALCRILVEVVANKGFVFAPTPGGATVEACYERDLEKEFYAQFHVNGDLSLKQKLDRRRKAYRRAMDEGAAPGFIRTRDDPKHGTIVWARKDQG